MAGEAEAYLIARRDFEAIARDLETFAAPFATFVNNLRSDPPKSCEWWPDRDAVQNRLDRFHNAREMVQKAWSEVPEELRAGLQPLPPRAELPPSKQYR